ESAGSENAGAEGIGAEGTASGPAAAARRPAVLVQVVISLASLLGIDSRSGYLDGYGAINPSVIRDLIESTDVTMTRLLCDPVAGSVMVADLTRYTPTAGLKHATGFRDRHCRLPVCTARVRHLDHIQARVDAGLTTEQNLQGLCERSHLAKHHPSWHVHGDATKRRHLDHPHGTPVYVYATASHRIRDRAAKTTRRHHRPARLAQPHPTSQSRPPPASTTWRRLMLQVYRPLAMGAKAGIRMPCVGGRLAVVLPAL
ncbi:MAG: hypothetical protein H0V02_00510, partial [Nocardioidaceae bacterium]|nr:hypothetical protein [Nocardioidaceae bacterium]